MCKPKRQGISILKCKHVICLQPLQWIPAHCGILGNEQADILAKAGCQRRTTCQQCQLQWKEDSHQSAYKAKITEGWLPPATGHSGEASHRT